MAAITCTRCKSPNIRSTTTGRVNNSHICNVCGYTFTLFSTGNLIGPIVGALIGEIAFPKVLSDLGDDAKKLGDEAKKLFSGGNRPAPARPRPGAAAAIPPRPQPGGGSTPQYHAGGTPPRHHPMPPVQGQPPSVSPPRASPPPGTAGREAEPNRYGRSPDPRAG